MKAISISWHWAARQSTAGPPHATRLLPNSAGQGARAEEGSAPSLAHLAARKTFHIHLQLPHRASKTTNAMSGVSRCRQISAQAWQTSEAAGFPHDTDKYARRIREKCHGLAHFTINSRIPSITRRKAPASCRCMGTLGS